VLLCLKMETELVAETSRFLKKLDYGKSPKKYMPFNIIRAIFSS